MIRQFQRDVRKAASDFGHRCLGRRSCRRFALLAHARTGSNYLSAGLSQLDSVRMHHEVFAAHNRKIGENFDSILSGVFGIESETIQAVGFKVFYYHLTPSEWTRLQRYDLAWIHLTRLNRLRTIVSLDIAFATNTWLLSNPDNAPSGPATIRLDPAKLSDRIRELETMEKTARRQLKSRSYLECSYEDLIKSPEEQFGRIADFLGIGGRIDPKAIHLLRQNPEPLSLLIENYEEVSKVLQGTAYSSYLKE